MAFACAMLYENGAGVCSTDVSPAYGAYVRHTSSNECMHLYSFFPVNN